MKITSASKKVLASALSAAMVVAFAPTVAFGAVGGTTDTSKWTDEDYVAAGAIAKKTWITDKIYNTYYFSAAQLNEGMSATYEAFADYATFAASSEDMFSAPGEAVEQDDVIADMNAVVEGVLKTADSQQATAAEIMTGAYSDFKTTEGALAEEAFNGYKAQIEAIAQGTYYLSSDTASGTIKLLKDVKATTGLTFTVDAGTGSDGLTLDLNGFTLSNFGDEDTANADLINLRLGDLTVKGGTLNATDNKATKVTYEAITEEAAAGKLTVENVTADQVAANVDAAKGTVKLGNVTGLVSLEKAAVVETGSISEGATVAKGSSLTASITNSKPGSLDAPKAVAAIGKGLVVTGADATVNATAVNSKGAATAIAGGIKAVDSEGKNYTGVTVTATAKTTGANEGAGKNYAQPAIAVSGPVQVASLTAKADSDNWSACGIDADAVNNVGLTESKLVNATVSASGTDKDSGYAVWTDGNVSISGGSYDGLLGGFTKGTYVITGGTFTDNPTDYVNPANYDVTKSGSEYTVAQFKDFQYRQAAGDNATALNAYVEGALETLSTGGTVAGLTFAEGWDAQKLLAHVKAEGNGAQGLDIKYSVKAYSEKTATDEQKAAKAAIEKAVEADLAYTKDELFQVVSVTLGYTAKNAVDRTVIATVTDMGTKTQGLQTVDNLLDVEVGNVTGTVADSAWIATGATATKVAYKDTDKDNKPNPEDELIQLKVIPSVIACASIDQEAVKNAAQKGEEVAVEKATQGIDVAKKSMTVKLGAKKTKLAKSKTFSMGASAETALTTSKKSGSKYITVSGQKVTLKKGVKRGTYTAKVSLKAAASAEYLAAAKTITVKFVIK